MTVQFPRCPDPLPADLTALAERLAAAWRDSALRPTVTPNIRNAWDQLIDQWIRSADAPLLVRKSNNNRGAVLMHSSGRELVPTDNSPANWALSTALQGRCPDVSEIPGMLAAGQIPVALALKAPERRVARYTGTRGSVVKLNQLGWKVCHVQPVSLGSRAPLESTSIEIIHSHFRRFLAPSNMFVVPLKWSGLGELPQLLRLFKAS